MSILVVVKKNGRAAIAGDSLSLLGSELKVEARYRAFPDKIHRIENGFIGLTGWGLFQNILPVLIEQYRDDFRFDSQQSLFNCTMRWHEHLKQHCYISPMENVEHPVESSQMEGMIAHSSGIYGFTSLRHVVEYNDFWAMGSGREFALGSLHVNFNRLKSAEAIARAAAEAACAFDVSCGEPVFTHSIKCQTA